MKKFSFLLLGHVCVGLGFLGAFLPLLPTTPFLLVAAFAYSRGSERFHYWLLSHRRLGPYIRDWQLRGAIPAQAKALAVVLIVLNIALVVFVLKVPVFAQWVVSLTLLAVSGFILTRPS